MKAIAECTEELRREVKLRSPSFDFIPPAKTILPEVVKEYEENLGLQRNFEDKAQVEEREALVRALEELFAVEVAAIRTHTAGQNDIRVVSLKAEGFHVGQLLDSWKTHLAAGGKEDHFYITFYSVLGTELKDAKVQLRKSLKGHPDSGEILKRVSRLLGRGSSEALDTVYEENIRILKGVGGKDLLIEYITEDRLTYLSKYKAVIYRILKEGFLLRIVTPVEGFFRGVRLLKIQA